MNRSPNPVLLVFGILFLVAAPLCYFGAGAYCFFQTRLYRASTLFRLKYPLSDARKLPDALQKAQQSLPARMEETFPVRVSLQRSGGPADFQLTVVGSIPHKTMYAANNLTLLVNEGLSEGWPVEGGHIHVFRIAEMPAAPSSPNVPEIMMHALFGALFSGALGVGCILLRHSLSPSVPPDLPSSKNNYDY